MEGANRRGSFKVNSGFYRIGAMTSLYSEGSDGLAMLQGAPTRVAKLWGVPSGIGGGERVG